MTLPSNFIFDMVIHLQNISVKVQFQGPVSKLKVTAAQKL